MRLRLAAFVFPCGARNDMLALYTKHFGRGTRYAENSCASGVQFLKPFAITFQAWRLMVKKSLLLSVPLTFGLFFTPAIPQTRKKFTEPPEALNPTTAEKVPTASSKHVDLAQLQRQADDLARNAQTIPADVASVRKGMLPRDVIEKLKQIEKLSKRLRSELNPGRSLRPELGIR